MKTWIIVDSNYLCHRAYHAMKDLSYRDVLTGVIFGFFRDIIDLQDRFVSDRRMVFTFDYGRSIRRQHCPTYKKKRQELSEREAKARKELDRQIKLLRREYLLQIGFKNVFSQFSYEADDIIASVCQNLPEDESDVVIVSADKDLFQLLGPRVSIYNPSAKKIVTEKSFRETYLISPSQWVDCKAIAGCPTDEVPGILGIGEKTAAKFLSGKLPTHHKAFDRIVKGNSLWKSNIPIVKLPYPGTEVFELCRGKVEADKWEDLADRLGMKSIRDKVAGSPRRRPERSRGRGFGLK